MPSAYVLAKDHIEQARAMLSSEVWYDEKIESVLDQAVERLVELDRRVYEYAPPEEKKQIRPELPPMPAPVLLWRDM